MKQYNTADVWKCKQEERNWGESVRSYKSTESWTHWLLTTSLCQVSCTDMSWVSMLGGDGAPLRCGDKSVCVRLVFFSPGPGTSCPACFRRFPAPTHLSPVMSSSSGHWSLTASHSPEGGVLGKRLKHWAPLLVSVFGERVIIVGPLKCEDLDWSVLKLLNS